ncbi:hypothetical protein RU06_14715 [Curtobacterium flaccumfaciens]|nr:hypothetical protein RU06_14715 [Curtobacterium flaccumfaciens]
MIDYAVRSGDTPVSAADAVRAERPQALIVAVIAWPEPANWPHRLEYSDLPDRYRELRRYNGPLDGHHGYMVVTPSADGSRGTVPNRPISLEQARWHRDWMLQGFFESLHWHLQHQHFPPPCAPEIVRLETIDE